MRPARLYSPNELAVFPTRFDGRRVAGQEKSRYASLFAKRAGSDFWELAYDWSFCGKPETKRNPYPRNDR